MTSNLYKVGDWVYCEVSPFQPYVVRKIEELTKTPNGNVEAKVLCAFRLHDIPSNVLTSVERYQPKTNNKAIEDGTTKTENSTETNTNSTTTTNTTTTTTNNTQTNVQSHFEEQEVADLNEQQRYNLKHREVFYSKFTDTIAATSIRAKCAVLLFNEEIEKYSEYLNREDNFFYHLTYDPYQKSLINDKGEIRVGFRYQTEIPALRLTPNGSVLEEPPLDLVALEKQQAANDRVLRSRHSTSGNAPGVNMPEIPISSQTDEMFQWCPVGIAVNDFANSLTDEDIDKFLILAKSVGTFARALDCNNAFKQPSLPLSAAAASRDITLQHALNVLHDNDYDIGKAALALITSNGPLLCKDEIEDWSAAEANLFEDALEKYGKDFNEIRKDYLPWKSLKSIIEYYYTWKTTDRYVQRKNVKLNEQESKLKQVYIPNHSKQNQSALIKSSHVQVFNQYDVILRQSCESCGCPNTSTNLWYAYNPTDLVKHIMTGGGNGANHPQTLANAQAQAIANILANNPAQANANGGNIHIYQARLCADCWAYWKKFAQFKYPNARQERLNQLKNQVHKCSVNGCSKEFKQKQLLIKHCGVAHGYFPKANNPPQADGRPQVIRNRSAFFLLTTPMTKAARLVCLSTIKMRRLAKKPFKLVELSELNKEWAKEARNITLILEEIEKKRKENPKKVKKLDVPRIDVIHKNRVRQVRATKVTNGEGGGATNGGMNGHQNGNGAAADEENSNDLVIDNDGAAESDETKPDYFKYFEQKCTEPCYTPEQFLFPKPTSEQVNKFFNNIMTQNRKRTLEQANNVSGNTSSGEKLTNGSSTNTDSDSGPVSKKSNNVVVSSNGQLNNGIAKQAPNNAKQTVRPSQKNNKPLQSINLPNSPEEIYYVALPTLKTIRSKLEVASLRRLARKPHKILTDQYQPLYQSFEKISVDSLAKVKSVTGATVPNGVASSVKDNTEVSQSSTDSSMANHQNGAEESEKPAGVVVLD